MPAPIDGVELVVGRLVGAAFEVADLNLVKSFELVGGVRRTELCRDVAGRLDGAGGN